MSSPTIWQNSPVKSISNLHPNPERETKLCYPLTPLENLHQKPFFVFYLFIHCPTYLETTMSSALRAHIFTKLFFPSCQNLLSLLPNCWRSIFNVFAKFKDDNTIWQTAGDTLRCSNSYIHRMQEDSIPIQSIC
jgi:hypothetical protein